MTIRKGRQFLLKIEDPDDATAFITVALLQATSVSLSASYPTAKDLLQHTQEQLIDDTQFMQAAAGVQCSGFYSDDASLDQLTDKLTAGARFNARLIFVDGAEDDYIDGTAKIDAISMDGAHNGATSFNCTLKLFNYTIVRAQYAVWNADDKSPYVLLSNDDKTMEWDDQSTASGVVRATAGHSSGRFYFEFDLADGQQEFGIGLCDADLTVNSTAPQLMRPGYDPNNAPNDGGTGFGLYYDGTVSPSFIDVTITSDSFSATRTLANDEIFNNATAIGVAVDFDHGIAEFYPLSPADDESPGPSFIVGFETGYTYFPAAQTESASQQITLNSGYSDFVGSVPANYAEGFTLAAPTQSSINTETTNEATYTILDRSVKALGVALYPDGLTCAHFYGAASSTKGTLRSKTGHSTGKYYFEVTFSNLNSSDDALDAAMGLVTAAFDLDGDTFASTSASNPGQVGVRDMDISGYFDGTYNGYTFNPPSSTMRTLSAAVDLDGSSVEFRDETNDASLGTFALPPGETLYIAVDGYNNGRAMKAALNAGQSAFVGSVPAGYTAGWPSS